MKYGKKLEICELSVVIRIQELLSDNVLMGIVTGRSLRKLFLVTSAGI